MTTPETINKTRNLLIAIEGIDGVGKNTQATLLTEALKLHNTEGCALFSFPRYETVTGMKVREYLNGHHDELNLLSRAKLYSDDRLAAREEILDLLYRGNDVVCDRYVDSNAAFQVCIAALAKPDTDYKNRVRDYIYHLEYGSYMLPRPNLTFILNVDVATSQRLIEERYNGTQTTKDKHERNVPLLELTHRTYREMVSQPGYVEIICNNPDTTLRTREDIHAEILAKTIEQKQVQAVHQHRA